MPAEQPEHRIVVRLDRLLEERGMTLTELAEEVDVTVVNLSVLKNGRAGDPLCEALDLPARRLTRIRVAQSLVLGWRVGTALPI